VRNFSRIQNCTLFAGMSQSGLENLLTCLSARQKKYEKDSFVFMEGDEPRWAGIVLSGCVQIVHDDFWGNRTIITRFVQGEFFGEAFAYGAVKALPVSIVATEKSEILLIDCKKILITCASSCDFHHALIQNMVKNLAQKNILLMHKMEYITRRTTREKLLAYLSFQAQQAKNNAFEIPYNRQELANYLSIDRSAMSSELGRLRTDGILRFTKNKFVLLRA